MYVFIKSSHLSLIMHKYSPTISPCICMSVHPSHHLPVCAVSVSHRPIISPSSAGCMLNDISFPKSCKLTSQSHSTTHREQPRCRQPRTLLRREQAGRVVPPFSLQRSPGEGPAWWYILAVASCWRRKCLLHTATFNFTTFIWAYWPSVLQCQERFRLIVLLVDDDQVVVNLIRCIKNLFNQFVSNCFAYFLSVLLFIWLVTFLIRQ